MPFEQFEVLKLHMDGIFYAEFLIQHLKIPIYTFVCAGHPSINKFRLNRKNRHCACDQFP